MPRFSDWSSIQEVKDIVERFLERFPAVFEGFDTDEVHFILTKKKKSKEPIKVHAVGYPKYIFMKPFIFETFETWWKDMDNKRKNLAVWKAMCSVPTGGFDDASKNYGRKLQPEIKMYMREYAACGGVPNWMENPLAKDPMERTPEDLEDDVPKADVIPGKDIKRMPVSIEDIADMGDGDEGEDD